MSDGVSIFDLDSGVDFGDVKERRFSQVPPGIYGATVASIEDGQDRSGKRRVAFTYVVSESPEDERWVGKKVVERKYYKDNTDAEGLGYIKARLVDLGLPKDYKGAVDTENFVGNEVVITLAKNGEYTNVTKVEVVGGEAAADGVPVAATTPSDDDDPFA